MSSGCWENSPTSAAQERGLNDGTAGLKIQHIIPQAPGPTGGILQVPENDSGFAPGLATKHQGWPPGLPTQPESNPAFGPALASVLINTTFEFQSFFRELECFIWSSQSWNWGAGPSPTGRARSCSVWAAGGWWVFIFNGFWHCITLR